MLNYIKYGINENNVHKTIYKYAYTVLYCIYYMHTCTLYIYVIYIYKIQYVLYIFYTYTLHLYVYNVLHIVYNLKPEHFVLDNQWGGGREWGVGDSFPEVDHFSHSQLSSVAIVTCLGFRPPQVFYPLSCQHAHCCPGCTSDQTGLSPS